MSNKPAKKSDENKPWRNNKRRDRCMKMPPEYHLIITEGNKTEPQYFAGLREEINKQYRGHISIEIKGVGEGCGKMSLVNFAAKFISLSAVEYKHVWLVYDKDDFPADDFDNTYFKCKELSNKHDICYHALWSNECIEYWFLLHFMFLDSAVSRNEYYSKLTKCLNKKYEKNCTDIYYILKPNIAEAIKNARKIAERNEGLLPSQCTPGTAVYEIFENLKNYL